MEILALVIAIAMAMFFGALVWASYSTRDDDWVADMDRDQQDHPENWPGIEELD